MNLVHANHLLSVPVPADLEWVSPFRGPGNQYVVGGVADVDDLTIADARFLRASIPSLIRLRTVVGGRSSSSAADSAVCPSIRTSRMASACFVSTDMAQSRAATQRPPRWLMAASAAEVVDSFLPSMPGGNQLLPPLGVKLQSALVIVHRPQEPQGTV